MIVTYKKWKGTQRKPLPFSKNRCNKASKHIIMIIEYQVFSKDYIEKILNNRHPYSSVCPKCGAKDKFHRHGTYQRFIACLCDAGGIVFETIEILRLQCQSCDSTHSILPGDIIPFQVYSLTVVLYLCEEIFINKASIRNTVRKTNGTVQTIYQKLNLLKRSLILIEFYLRQISLYTAAVSIPLTQAVTFLLLPDMRFSSYFHCHGQPIFLNRRNTSSYPLYFAAAFSG